MEKMSYEEAKEWFWVRTFVWAVPAIALSIAAHFWYAGELDKLTASRISFAVGVGALSVLIAVLTAAISIQWPWMRSGRWFGFMLTAPLCAILSAFTAFLLSGVLLGIVRDNVNNLPSGSVIDAMYKAAIFAVAVSGFWGFLFGTWFSLRRDRYFVDSI